ncbi:MAG TPA: hypothetical protein VGX23_00715 [Actinocrinis sp.]|nr:hypothetical protein [Actinocrinis sp.]
MNVGGPRSASGGTLEGEGVEVSGDGAAPAHRIRPRFAARSVRHRLHIDLQRVISASCLG